MSRRYGYVTHLNEIFQKVPQSCKGLSMNCRARLQSCRWVVESCTQNQALAQVLMKWRATKPAMARLSKACWSATSTSKKSSKIKGFQGNHSEKGGSLFCVVLLFCCWFGCIFIPPLCHSYVAPKPLCHAMSPTLNRCCWKNFLQMAWPNHSMPL